METDTPIPAVPASYEMFTFFILGEESAMTIAVRAAVAAPTETVTSESRELLAAVIISASVCEIVIFSAPPCPTISIYDFIVTASS